jgi:act minimal PKS chain-length factor (CLF/KS beta)
MTGRLYSGGGPLDLVAALLSIRDHVLPPTINVTVAPQYEIDLVIDTPRKAVADVALVIARGHGGFNSAVILRGTH